MLVFFLNGFFNFNLIFFKHFILTISGSNEEKKPCNDKEIKPQETQGSKRPHPNSFFQTDDYYDPFCKPSLYFPSIQKCVQFEHYKILGWAC